MKRVLILALAAVMFAAPAWASNCLNNNINVKVNAQASATVGDEFWVEIEYKAGSSTDGVDGLNVTVAYDSLLLELIDDEQGSQAPSDWSWPSSVGPYTAAQLGGTFPSGTNMAAYISCTGDGLGDWVDTTFKKYGRLKFKALDDGTAKIAFKTDLTPGHHGATVDNGLCTVTGNEITVTNDTVQIYDLMKAGLGQTQWSIVKQLYK